MTIEDLNRLPDRDPDEPPEGDSDARSEPDLGGPPADDVVVVDLDDVAEVDLDDVAEVDVVDVLGAVLAIDLDDVVEVDLDSAPEVDLDEVIEVDLDDDLDLDAVIEMVAIADPTVLEAVVPPRPAVEAPAGSDDGAGALDDDEPVVDLDDEPVVDLDDEPVVDLDDEPVVDLDDVASGPQRVVKDAAKPNASDEGDDAGREVPTYTISTIEDRDRLLAAAMAHAELQDLQYSQPLAETERTGQWKTPLALIVFALAAYIGFAPPSWLADSPPPAVTEADLDQGVLAALTTQAEQIRLFHLRTGRLPATLDEVPVRLPRIRYVRSNSRVFQLIAPRANGSALVYDSANPNPAFESKRATLLMGPGA